MCQRLRVINCMGGAYVIFAIVTAMAAFEAHDTVASDKAQVVANTGAKTVWHSERLPDTQGNPRRNVWLTIWTTRNCSWCEKQKAEIPALEKAGYNVVVRRAPAPRWVKGFPATVVTKGSTTGPVLKRINGFKTLAEFDSILGFDPEPEVPVPAPEPEVPDYNITQTRTERMSIVVWLDLSVDSMRQREEIAKLRKSGIRANIYMVNVNRWSAPTVILIDTMGNGRVVAVWRRLVSAEEIKAAMRYR